MEEASREDMSRQDASRQDVSRLVVPEFGVEGVPLSLSLWLVPVGARVLEGDRVVELLAGGATIDLVAPVSGRLVRQLVEEDEPIAAGTVLGEFERARSTLGTA